MFYCKECGFEFEKPIKQYESHRLSYPPYERQYLCPNCKGTSISQKTVTHCRCCGAKIKENGSTYCSKECKIKGEKLWKKEIEKKQLQLSNPINILVREIEEYNKRNKTNYSYGQYIAYVYSKKGVKKCTKKKSRS